MLDPTLSAMYQDALLAHYRAPHNRRTMEDASGEGARRNPLCGDEIRVQVALDDDRIVDVAFTGHSCSITTASASIMTDAVHTLRTADASGMASGLEAMLQGQPAALADALSPLRGVAPFPARHGCATMPWAALRDALQNAARNAVP